MALAKSASFAEEAVDNAHRQHALLQRGRPDAVAHLLLAAEEVIAADSVQLDLQDRSIGVTQVVNALKHAVRWVATCTQEAPPRGFAAEAISEAHDLLNQAIAYCAIVAAYSFARRGFLDLRADHHHLITTLPSDEDVRYDAYDLMVLPSVELGHDSPGPKMDGLIAEIGDCLRRGFSLAAIPLTRRVLAAAYDVSAALNDPKHQLPDEWEFASFRLGDYRIVSNAIRATLGAWQIANQMIAQATSHNAAQLFVVNRRELRNAVRDVTGCSRPVVDGIFELLSYGHGGSQNPDPALQPLIPVSKAQIALSSPLVTGGSPERNLLALVNTLPEEKASYDGLKNMKEGLMRERLEARKPGWLRSWQGYIAGRRALGDIDYALIDDRSSCVLICELKWFVAPAEPRELADREKDLWHGVQQIGKRLKALTDSDVVAKTFGARYANVAGVVVSANAIGSFRAQDALAAIINEEHFLSTLDASDNLQRIIEWLFQRQYLPVANVDFRYHRYVVSYFDWQLDWYGLEALQKGAFLPV